MAYLEVLTVAGGPIAVALAKSHGRIRTNLEDALIQVYLDGVFQFVEDFIGADVRQKTYEQTGEQLNSSIINHDNCEKSTGLILDASQVVSVESVFYLANGVETELLDSEYHLFKKTYQSFITPVSNSDILSLASRYISFPKTDGGPNGYTIRFTTDWPTLPPSLIVAMLNHFMFDYENRGDAIAAGATAGSGLITAPPESLATYRQFRATRV